MSIAEVLRTVTDALDRAELPYMLTGSSASTYYGAPRTTQDIDLVVATNPQRLQSFVEFLPADKYYADLDAALEAHRHRSLFNVLDRVSGWKIDLIIRKDRAFSQEEFRRRKKIVLDGVPVFAATPEDVIISKLEWAKMAQSERQIEDVAGILRIRWKSLDQAYIEHWVRELGLEAEWNAAHRDANVGGK